MNRYQVWINEGYSNHNGERREPTVVEVQALSVQVNDYGALGFYGISEGDRVGLIECFARGHWTRWKRIA
jgi:hypothetical protein